jgi:hypothetical protein
MNNTATFIATRLQSLVGALPLQVPLPCLRWNLEKGQTAGGKEEVASSLRPRYSDPLTAHATDLDFTLSQFVQIYMHIHHETACCPCSVSVLQLQTSCL